MPVAKEWMGQGHGEGGWKDGGWRKKVSDTRHAVTCALRSMEGRITGCLAIKSPFDCQTSQTKVFKPDDAEMFLKNLNLWPETVARLEARFFDFR